MNDSKWNTNLEPRDGLRPAGDPGYSSPRHKPHSLAPTAGDVEIGEVKRPKRRRDLLPWIMAISAVATVATMFAVYAARGPQLYTSESGSAVETASDDEVFEPVSYGALRWRATSREVPSDYAPASGMERGEETGSLGPDLVVLADSLRETERHAAQCAGVTTAEDVKMSVTFHPAGYVVWADVQEGVLGAEAEDCIEAAVMSTATPTFIGEELTIQHVFRLR